MPIDLQKLSTPELTELVEKIGVEFAKRNEPGPPEPPGGPFYFSYGQPFAMGVDKGKLTFRVRSALYGWVNFKWSKEAAIVLQKMIADCLAKGVTPSSERVADIVQNNWAKH